MLSCFTLRLNRLSCTWRLTGVVAVAALCACSGGHSESGGAGGGGGPPILPLAPGVTSATLPRPFDERFMQATRAALPIGPAQLARLPHFNPRVTAATSEARSPQNTGDADNGGQSGYIIAPGTAGGDGGIYVAMTAYNDVWVTTPTDGSYNTIYAPTTHGPNGNCIETVTNYYNGFGTPGTTVDQIEFYDFCANSGQGGFVGALPMDANFVRDYVRTYADAADPMPRYVSAVIHLASDNRWHAYLYNASLMKYVDYYASAAGQSTTELGAEGWSIFETHYNGGACSTLPDTSESSLQIHTSSGWQLLGGAAVSSYVWGTCFSAPLSVPYYLPAFSTSPSDAWTVTSHVSPALSEYASVIRADAPLAYYRLGDTGTSAFDSSNNTTALNGSYGANVKRGAHSLLAAESSNTAAQFSGGPSAAVNIVAVPPAQRLQPAKAVTLETWIAIGQPNAGGTTDLVSYGPETAGQAYTLQLLADDTLAAYIVTSGDYGFVSGKTVLAKNKAYLIDATYNGLTLSLYVDGALDASTPVSGALNYSHVGSTNGLSIGSAFSSAREAFSGTLDEVSIFGSGLTASRIAAHWTAGSGVAAQPAVSQYASDVNADAPLAFYRLSDASPVATDATANHLNATYGSTILRNVAGLLSTDPTNNGALFPGGASQPSSAVMRTRDAKLEPPLAVTIEAWIDVPAKPRGTIDLVSYGPELLGQPYTLQLLADGTVAMFVTTTQGYGFVAATTPVALNTPHLIDAMYNGSALEIFVDGSLQARSPATGALNYSRVTTPFGLSIGTAFDTNRLAFNGELDDVAIYGEALARQRVSAHWVAGSGHPFGPLSLLR
jgi:hypothetical protein